MYDEFYDVKCTADGGFIAVGETWSFGAGDVDWYVVKTDSMGHLQWSRTFGGIYDDRARAVTVTAEGDFVVAGWISGDTSRYEDFALIKIGADGDSIWGRTYGGQSSDLASDVLQTEDGGFVIAGQTHSFGAGGYDAWLLKTDADGDSVWSHTYGGRGWDAAYSIAPTADGGFALAGETGSFGAGAYDMWLVRTDSIGDSLWSRTYGGGSFDEARSMALASDGGFMLAGYTGSFGQGWENAWFVKTDSSGNMEWNRTFGNGLQVYALDIVRLPDGGYIAGGFYSNDVGNTPFWLLRINSNGDSLWGRIWGDTHADGINALERTSDGGYVLAGLIGWRMDRTSGDAVMMRTAPDPAVAEEHPYSPVKDYSIAMFPNPFNSVCTIAFALPTTQQISLKVYDLLGREVSVLQQGWAEAGTHNVRFDAGNLPSGIYFYRLIAGSQSLSRKMVLLK